MDLFIGEHFIMVKIFTFNYEFIIYHLVVFRKEQDAMPQLNNRELVLDIYSTHETDIEMADLLQQSFI